MRYIRATFTGYIGFYNGMGLETVDIDFSRCKHSIVLIVGINGCGKSTLIDSLNLFPDPSTSFVPNKDASKTLVLSDGINVYIIHIISEADAKGGRKTTKAFIQKNGSELNPNGNVSTYKDIIFSEFDLDSNFISLSSLSSNNRGLGDKTPAERKKFVSSIIDNLEVYNNIYKTLNKKSLVFKSNLNNLHTKIQNIGDKDTVEQRLFILKNKEADLNDKIVAANNMIVSIQAKNSLDEEETLKVQQLTQSVNEYSSKLNIISAKLDSYHHNTHVKREDIEIKYNEAMSTMNEHSSTYDIKNTEWKNIHERLGRINQDLQDLKTESLKFDVNTDLERLYKESKEQVEMLRSSVDTSLSEDELIRLIEFNMKFVSILDAFYNELTPQDIEFLVKEYSPKKKNELLVEQHKYINQIDIVRSTIADIESDLKVKSVLLDRPKNCNINTCPFISDAIKIKDSPEQLADKLSIENDKLLSLSDSVSKIQEKIDLYDLLFSNYMKLVELRNLVSDNNQLLLKTDKLFLENCMIRISNLDQFNDRRDTSNLDNQLNNLRLFKLAEDNHKDLEVDYKIYREKIQILNSNRAKTEKLEAEKTELESNVLSLKTELDQLSSTINNLKSLITTYGEYKHEYETFLSVESEYKIYKSQLDAYESKSKKALDSMKEIETNRLLINSLTEQLKPIVNDINIISGQLTLLDSYYSEYNEYKKQYDLIETVKKYCSPTGGGIQTIFMQLYMSKTLMLSNDVLEKLFGGQYKLLDFVINDKEFRIPFVGGGLNVDDISSGSSSQISMFGMIINLVLLNQASTKFNIARLDEIDAGLDNRNRFEFINFLFYTMNILNIEQVFLISHSMEADNSNADIIKLKTYDDFESGIQSGNVIYDYREAIK